MDELSIQEWRVFLKARIEQEQGRDEQALHVFDSLLQKHPRNPHLAASRAFALARLGRDTEATAATVAVRYAALGRALVGDQDKPEVWTSELHALLSEMDDFAKSGRLAATLVAW